MRLRLKIKEIGEAKGFNMSSLSRASDISFGTIKRLWKYPESTVRTGTLERIAKTLGVRLSDLLVLEKDEEFNW